MMEITCNPYTQNVEAVVLEVRGQLSYRLHSISETSLSYIERLWRRRGSANMSWSKYPVFTIKQGRNREEYMHISPAGPLKADRACAWIRKTVLKDLHSLGQKRKLLRIKGRGDTTDGRGHVTVTWGVV